MCPQISPNMMSTQSLLAAVSKEEEKVLSFFHINAAGGYLRVIPEWFHLIRNGNGHIWGEALGVSEIKSCNLTHGGENFKTEGESKYHKMW